MRFAAGYTPSSRTHPPDGAEYHTEPQTLETRHSRYRAFGERFNIGGSNPSRLDPSFQGRTYDAGLGIYDYRNRSFDPCTGRFLQRDPQIGGDSLYNPYGFPGNNPVGNVDPMGLGEPNEPKPEQPPVPRSPWAFDKATCQWTWDPRAGREPQPPSSMPLDPVRPKTQVDFEIERATPLLRGSEGEEKRRRDEKTVLFKDLFTLEISFRKRELPKGAELSGNTAVLVWFGRLTPDAGNIIVFPRGEADEGRGKNVEFRTAGGAAVPRGEDDRGRVAYVRKYGESGTFAWSRETRSDMSHKTFGNQLSTRDVVPLRSRQGEVPTFRMYTAWHGKFVSTLMGQGVGKGWGYNKRTLEEARGIYYLVLPYSVAVLQGGRALSRRTGRETNVWHVTGRVHRGFFILSIDRRNAPLSRLQANARPQLVEGEDKNRLLRMWGLLE